MVKGEQIVGILLSISFFLFAPGIDSSAMQIPMPILHNKQIR